MPYAVTHILVPIILVAIFRDFYLRNKDRKKFPLHYVLIAGLGGVLPDIDLAISVLLKFAGVANWYVHKTFTHSLFFPAIFFLIYLVLLPVKKEAKICNLTRHKLKLSTISLMIAIGSLIHILLDALVGGPAFFFYPFISTDFGFYLTSYLPASLESLSLPLLDGILLVIWIVYLELKHKISDFI